MRIARLVAAVSVVMLISGCGQKPGDQAPAPDTGGDAVATSSTGLTAAQAEADGEAHHSSPWEYGASLRFSLPVWASSNVSLHPVGSFTYFTYDGGHETRFDVGGQVRYAIRQGTGPMKAWIGAEAVFAFLNDDFGTGSESYSGPAFNAIFGIPIGTGKWSPQIVGGAGVSSYGSGSNWGKNVRVGIAVTPFNR